MAVGREKTKAVGDRQEWLAARPGQFTVPRTQLVSALKKLLGHEKATAEGTTGPA